MMISAVQGPALEQLSSSQNVSTGGKLPSENAVVLVKVLDRLEGTYKLLVDGSVFQAKLPFAANNQEEFLAKVLSVKPLLLQADNLAALKAMTPAMMATYLQKLGIKVDFEAKQLLEILLKRNRPLVKSKFEALSGLFEENKKIDDLQAALLAGLYYAPAQELQDFKSEAGQMFLDSLEVIIDKIYKIIVESLKKQADVMVRPALEAAFLSPEGKKAQSARKIPDLVQQLVLFARGRGKYNQDDESRRAAELGALLSEYLVQKAVYNRFSVFPDFIISALKGGYMLSVFYHTREGNENKYTVSCDIGRGKDTTFIRLRGTLEGKLARMACFSSAIGTVIAAYMQELNELMAKNNFNVSVYVQDIKKTGGAVPALSSINCKV